MKTQTGLTIVHREVKGKIVIEAYTEQELKNRNDFSSWWNNTKKTLGL